MVVPARAINRASVLSSAAATAPAIFSSHANNTQDDTAATSPAAVASSNSRWGGRQKVTRFADEDALVATADGNEGEVGEVRTEGNQMLVEHDVVGSGPAHGVDRSDPFVFIEHIRRHPSTLEFVYLEPVAKDSPLFNPYKLRIIKHHLVDESDYYTLSARGLTHFQVRRFARVDADCHC